MKRRAHDNAKCMMLGKLCGILTKRMHQSWGVVWFAVGIIGGVVMGVVMRVNYFGSGWFLVLSGIFGMICYVRPLYITAFLSLLAGFLVSFFRVSVELGGAKYIQNLAGETVMVTGEVAADPNTDETETRLKLAGLKFGDGCAGSEDNGWHAGSESGDCVEARGSVYVTLSKNEELKRGDMVILNGKMGEGFGTYAGYMYRPKIIKVARLEPGNLVVRVRDWFAARIRGNIPETEANLGLSYLLGMKAGLDEGLNEKLRVVGLTHIVVASGAHLSILVEVAKKIFGKVSRLAGAICSGIFVVFFMAMVGWTPSIMRAGVMAILTLVTWYVGRKIAPMRLILLVAAGTLIYNPMFIMDLGWMLSFASFIGIMELGPRLVRYFYGERKPGFVGETVMTTFAATLMTLPVVLYYYGQVSLINVVANLLILPTLSVAMGLTFLTGVVAGAPVVETAVAWVTTKLLDYHIGVVGMFGEMRQFLVKIEPYQAWVFGVYVVIGGAMLVAARQNVLKVIKLGEGS